jgi:MSHA biogenesis protein MshO
VGFTLIELITVIVIIGILASLTTKLLIYPIQSYLTLQSRNMVADTAVSAFQMMQRDIRRALPNSIRVSSNGLAIELLHTSDGGRYRAYLGTSGGNILDFTQADTQFDVIGSLSAAPTSGSVVVYNLNELTSNAYAGTNIAAINIASSSATEMVLSTPTQFPMPSPQQRFFIVDLPITYSCDLVAGNLLRYSGYAIPVTQSNPPVGGTAEIQANKVTNCSFSYVSGAASRSGLVTIQLSFTDSYGATETLLQQVHVDNAP